MLFPTISIEQSVFLEWTALLYIVWIECMCFYSYTQNSLDTLKNKIISVTSTEQKKKGSLRARSMSSSSTLWN